MTSFLQIDPKPENAHMAPYLRAVLSFKKENDEPASHSYQHTSQIDPVEHDPKKLTEIKIVKWDQTVMSHAISW